MAAKEIWEEIIRTNFTDLLRLIETENGLQGELGKINIFSPLEFKAIWGQRNPINRNEKLLNSLLKKDFESFQKFCSALLHCNQIRVVSNHLSCVKATPTREQSVTDSAESIDPSSLRGISCDVKECLKNHYNDLILNIGLDQQLLAEIKRLDIFTHIQFIHLQNAAENVETEGIKLLLSLLEIGSERQFLDFCNALRECKQSRIVAQYLTSSTQTVLHDREREPQPAQTSTEQREPGDGQDLSQRNNNLEATSSNLSNVAIVYPIPVGDKNPSKDNMFTACNEDFLQIVKAKIEKKEAYRCDRRPRGRAVIINNQYFRDEKLQTREGSNHDSARLNALFTGLNFLTDFYCDKTAKEILDILRKESQEHSHASSDMFVLFLMSHGIRGEIYGFDGETIKTEDILKIFSGSECPKLVDKPKLIFIQACQGELRSTGVSCDVHEMVTSDFPAAAADDVAWSIGGNKVMHKLHQKEDFNLSLPLPPLPLMESDAVPDIRVHEMADMALIYATVAGYVAWRRRDTGSLFIQTLSNVIYKRAHEKDLMSMMTEVFNELHEIEVQATGERYKQIGEKRDTLRREVYLLPC